MTLTDTAALDGARADSLTAASFRTVFNSATGEQIEFTEVREDVVRLNWRSTPGGAITEHVHPRQHERFIITAGDAHFMLNGEERVVGPGETLDVPAGVPHSEGNPGSVDVVGVVELRPALHTKQMFEAFAGLAAEGKTTSRGAPKNPLQLGATVWHFRHESRATSPPVWLQNLVLAPLSVLAKVVRVRPYYVRWDTREHQPQPESLMNPSQQDPQDDPTHSDLDQTRADTDQTHSDRDQTSSDQDQGSADIDQLAADSDQAASDRDLAHGGAQDAYDSSREARERTTEARRTTPNERHNTASARDATAHDRDLSALARDRAAEARDLEDDGWDAEIASLTSSYGTKRRQAVGRSALRAARDRKRAASDRSRSAMHRVDADADRDRAAKDRELAAEDRVLAAEDRAQAAAEREADEIDTVTGARRRAPGLADIRREIDRAQRVNGRLVAAYVDVDGLKATNDARGHQAGDVMLKHIVGVLQKHLRAYEQVVRLGGDEFVCTISDTTIETVRERFAQITTELSLTPDHGSITVGFAQLADRDTPMDLINRADRQLMAARATPDHGTAGT
jgi:diguanylate cyclase (GGDEF)-like protein